MSDETAEVEVSQAPLVVFEPFALHKEKFLFSNLNVRTEKHGDERKPAIDLNFEASMHNSVLDKLHPELRDALYRPDDTSDMVDSQHKPHLRFKTLGTIPWEFEMPRVKLRLHDVDDNSNDLVMIDGRAKKFKITCIDGGSVKIAFQCQFSKPEDEDVAKLMRVLQQHVPISLVSEAAEEKGDNFDEVEKLGSKPDQMSEARKNAESLFEKDPTLPLALELSPETVVGLPVAEAESNVKPIKPRGKRTANGAAINAE